LKNWSHNGSRCWIWLLAGMYGFGSEFHVLKLCSKIHLSVTFSKKNNTWLNLYCLTSSKQ